MSKMINEMESRLRRDVKSDNEKGYWHLRCDGQQKK